MVITWPVQRACEWHDRRFCLLFSFQVQGRFLGVRGSIVCQHNGSGRGRGCLETASDDGKTPFTIDTSIQSIAKQTLAWLSCRRKIWNLGSCVQNVSKRYRLWSGTVQLCVSIPTCVSW